MSEDVSLTASQSGWYRPVRRLASLSPGRSASTLREPSGHSSQTHRLGAADQSETSIPCSRTFMNLNTLVHDKFMSSMKSSIPNINK